MKNDSSLSAGQTDQSPTHMVSCPTLLELLRCYSDVHVILTFFFPSQIELKRHSGWASYSGKDSSRFDALNQMVASKLSFGLRRCWLRAMLHGQNTPRRCGDVADSTNYLFDAFLVLFLCHSNINSILLSSSAGRGLSTASGQWLSSYWEGPSTLIISYWQRFGSNRLQQLLPRECLVSI